MKILYIVSTLKKSGPSNQLSYIIKYLDRIKFEPMILTLSPEPMQESMKEYFVNSLNVKVETLGLSRVKGLFYAKKYIESFIKENRIDFVHTQGIRADVTISKLNISRVSTLRNYPFYDYPMKFGKLKGLLMAKKHLAAIKKGSENNIACSKTIANEFKKNNLNLNYIQNGIDTQNYFPISKQKKKELREKLGIEIDKKIFITVGSLIARKDVFSVIEAFKKFNNKDSLLLIAGTGIEKERLECLVTPNIKFLGNISNVVEYLQLSDCFVSASWAEGLPNTVLEAMACGLPTILSDIPSHKELYENEDGVFFKKKDTDVLAQLLSSLSNNFSSHGDKSLELINKKFTAQAMSEKYQKRYLEGIL